MVSSWTPQTRVVLAAWRCSNLLCRSADVLLQRELGHASSQPRCAGPPIKNSTLVFASVEKILGHASRPPLVAEPVGPPGPWASCRGSPGHVFASPPVKKPPATCSIGKAPPRPPPPPPTSAAQVVHREGLMGLDTECYKLTPRKMSGRDTRTTGIRQDSVEEGPSGRVGKTVEPRLYQRPPMCKVPYGQNQCGLCVACKRMTKGATNQVVGWV